MCAMASTRRRRSVDSSCPSEEGLEQLTEPQRRLTALRLQYGGQIGSGELGPPILLMFEGWDASGKGGAIQRVTAPLDPRHVTVAQFAAPTEREKRHHFLWRFCRRCPAGAGCACIDRTWYGRVLVERVEGFATEPEWERAYGEIVDFERGLAAEGMVIVKFWLHVSPDEQLRRFKERERDPLKRWKLTDEDWRNRDRRPDYEQAIEEMLRRTDHPDAPWNVIAAENKHYARVAVVKTVNAALEQGLRAPGSSRSSRTELGAGGPRLALTRDSMRIVSLVPSATEMLFALGLGDELVGVTHECDYPADALELPKVTRDRLPGRAQRRRDRCGGQATDAGGRVDLRARHRGPA